MTRYERRPAITKEKIAPTALKVARITAEWLETHGACAGQRRAFRREWGDSCEVTPGVIRRAAEIGLDLDWVAERTLMGPAREELDRATDAAREEYDRARAAAWEELDRARAAAREEYDRARAAALGELDRARAAAREELDRATAAAWEELDRARAAAWEELDRATAAALIRILWPEEALT